MNWIQNVPKVELHCHLDGSVRPSTILDLSRKYGLDLPTYDLNELLDYLQVPEDCQSLKEYLERFTYPGQVMQTKEGLWRVTDELLEDCAKENVKYIEIRFAPLLHMQQGLSFTDVVDTVLDAIQQGEERHGILSNLILCCMRHEPVEKSIFLVQQAKPYLNKGVVAIDLAGNEADFPPELHKEAFDLAREYGFHITIHAGETGIGQNVRKSVELLHAERIGHGVFIVNDPQSYELVMEKQIPLEVCPQSNLHTQAFPSYEKHPVKDFFNAGLVINVSTDNRTVSDVTLSDEYTEINRAHGMTEADFIEIFKKSVAASFASDQVKAKLLAMV